MAKAEMIATVDVQVKKNKISRKWLYVIYVPLLLFEWAIDAVQAMYISLHTSIEELVLSLKKYIDEPSSQGAESSK